MNSRERVLLTLDHNYPDRIPHELGGANYSTLDYQAYVDLKKYLNLTMKESEVPNWIGIMEELDEKILQYFDIDFRRVTLKTPTNYKMERKPDGSFTDEWGLKFEKIGYYFEWMQKNAPLNDVESPLELDDYKWPDTESPGRTEGLEKQAKKYEEEGWAVVTTQIHGGIFELAWFLRGFERFQIDLIRKPQLACALMDKITDIYLKLFDQFLGAVGEYVQIISLADDLGAQNNLLLPPRIYREHVKPRHKKLFDFIHSRTDGKILLHCCGAVEPIINDLIEAGVDILNPIQPQAKGMDPQILKEKYGDKLVFHGGIDIQHVLPHGTEDEVQNEVKEKIRILAPNGGYIPFAAHNIQPDVPITNLVAMFEAIKKYGKYPISIDF